MEHNTNSVRIILINDYDKVLVGNLMTIVRNQRTIGPEIAYLKPDLGVLSQHEMTLTLNTHTH